MFRLVLPILLCLLAVSGCAKTNLNNPGPLVQLPGSRLPFKEHCIPSQLPGHKIYAREYQRNGPTIFLLHGFPDNLHLYDYLIPHLVSNFHVIAFDFMGWGKSSLPTNYPESAEQQKQELAQVIRYFNPTTTWLVAHDASGPPVLNYALENPDAVDRIVLLNTYFCEMDCLRKPEAIWLFSTPCIRDVAGVVGKIPPVNRFIYNRQVSKFIRDQQRRDELVPILYSAFKRPGNFDSFLSLNRDLDREARKNNARRSALASLGPKTAIIFGGDDPYLNPGVAREFHRLMPGSQMTTIPCARHYVQVDEAEAVANHISSLRWNSPSGWQ